MPHRQANLSCRIIKIMAKARVSTNPMYTGGAGGYSFYVRQSEQIVRQRKNNSNYGETARRTWAQMERRVKWSNLVNLYKACRLWMPKAFETKKSNQTDYNVFMQVNANRATVALTKDQALAGNCVVAPLQVSRGVLPSVGLAYNAASSAYVSDIRVSSAVTSATTIAALSTDIIANNPYFQDGDNIAIIKFINSVSGYAADPFATTLYGEITLDTSDQTTLSNVPVVGSWISAIANDYLHVSAGVTAEVGAVIIHTRKVSGSLQVSSQDIVMSNTTYVDMYSQQGFMVGAVYSYGVDSDVMLAPGEGGGDAPAFESLYLRSANLGGDEVNLIVTSSGSYVQFRDSGSSVASVPAILVASGQIQLLDGSDVESDLTWGYVNVPSSTISANVVQISYGGRDYVINLNANTITPAITAVYPS